jgi:hypothetical protein
LTEPRPDARRPSNYEAAVRVLRVWHEPWDDDKLRRWREATGETPLRADAVLELLRDLLVRA